ncbi:MAG: hypothetical protein RLY83_405 [Actinomycetota bacterium]|jgi:hypothetical protein
MSDPNLDPKLANAEAKAAKAKAKALRPWFKKKRFIVPIALVLIIGISNAANGGKSSGSTDTGSNTNTSTTEEKPATPGIGDAAVDGKFSFVVTAVKCGIKSVGSKYLNKKAQGQFCQVSLTVENVGKEPQTMFADNQKLFDGEDREFSPDTSAMIYMKDGSDAWVKEVNPGNTLKGSLLFDLPAGAEPSKIELHDDVFSSGVTVTLK